MVDNEKNLTQTIFEITNFTEDYTFDANTASLGVTSDVLATLIRDLIAKGIINPAGTVA